MIQIIIQIPKKVLFFWRRGAMDDAEAALSLKEGERTCSEFAQQSGCLAVSNRRERQGGTGLEGPEFEQVLQAFIRGQVSVAMMDQYCRQSRELSDGAVKGVAHDDVCRAMEETMKFDDFCGTGEPDAKPTTGETHFARRVAAYARDAAHRQDESNLAAQIRACVKQAEEDGSPVDPAYIYQEQGSGRDLDRSVLCQLRQATQAGEVGVVYVHSPERLSCDPQHFILLHQEFAFAGVELRFVKGFSSDNRDDRVCGGAAPGVYGYDYDEVEGVPTPDEQVVGTVGLVFELARKGWSAGPIAAYLNETGISNERGG